MGRKAVLLLALLAGLVPLLLASSQPATASAPVNTSAPTISGTAQLGQALTANKGIWSATPAVPDPAGYSYQWQRCGNTGVSSSTFAATGTRPYGIVFDSKGNLYTANFQANNVTKITPDGTATVHGTTGRRPNAITIDANDNVYTANYVDGTVTKITPDGTSSTLGQTGTWPWGIALDSAGNVYTSNSADNNVTKITSGGIPSTFGSTGAEPAGIVVDSSGTVFVTNYSGASITRITSDGQSNTSWATTSPGPYGLVMDEAGNLYTSNIGSDNVTKVAPDGSSTTLGTTGDQPWALTLDPAGNVFTANAGSSNVTRITPGGSSSTYGTTGTTPRAIALDSGGNVYTGNWDANNVTRILACEDISSTNNPTYTTQSADYQNFLKVKVTASNGVSPDGVAYSPPTSQVAGIPPTNAGGADAPSISGTAKVGQTLTADSGTWSGTPTPTYAYQWQRCETNSVAGVNWTTRGAPSSNGWRSVVWGGDKFVAVGGDVGDSTADDVLTSPDGVDWTARTAAQNNYWTSVAWGDPPGATPGQFVAVSSDGTDRVMTSSNGTDWVSRTAAAQRAWKSVTWGGPAGQETFVAVAEDGGVMTSPDGITWTSQTQPGGVDRDWRSVTWGDPSGATPGQFVAVAYSGTTAEQVMTSPDGVTWTAQTSAVANGWYGVTWGGTPGQEKFVAISLTGNGNQVMTSPDGITWTARTSPAGNRQWHSIAWGGPPGQETFVAVSDTGAPNQVMTSPNGIDWSIRSSSTGEKWRAVTWGGPTGQEKFVSVAYDQPPTAPAANRVMTSQGADCTNITDAENSTYTAQTADFNKYLRVKVTASNGASPNGVAYSSISSQVAGIPPTNDTAPSISGTARVRETLTANPGTWSGNPTPGISYQWQRCNSSSGSCTAIAATNSSIYQVQPADVGKYMRVEVTASNGAAPDGVASSPSPFPGPVEATPSQTLYVNKYSPGESSVPGCENPDFTEIGSADPAFGAVGAAVSGDTIFVCGSPTAATDPQTPTTGPYRPVVVLGSKSLNFVGEGPELTILDGENDRTLFFANAYDPGQPNSYLNLQSLTVKRGLDINDGGGIEAFCRDMALSNVHFTGNKTIGFGASGGGGISAQDAGCTGLSDITVNASVFTGNIAEFNVIYGQSGADGGAIRTTGSLTIDGSRFQGNEARATSGSNRAPRGGAVWAGAGVSISDSSFISNGAVGPGAFGGAIYSEGGPSTSTINGSTFSANTATGTNNFAGAVRRQAGDLTVTNSTFTGNQAADAPAVSSSDSITLRSVTLSANSGPYDIDAGYNLSIGNSIINETGDACRAPQPPSTYKVNLGGNVIADTTAADCDPFVGTGGGPGSKVAPSAIQLGALADNGGPTQTMALGLTSAAATSAGVNLLGANPKDQRGRSRPLTNQSSGAYQLTEPANTALPQITGDAEAGETLTSSTGTWAVSPPVTSYGYQWQRCEVSNSPTYVSGWGGPGSGNGQFNGPEWVAVDASGNVFVADGGNARIQKFDASGNYLRQWGSAGSGPGQFQNIGGIAVGPGGDVYVTDTGNNRVQKFSNQGTYIRQWGTQGSGNGQFNSPGPLATDSSGNVYVTDYNNARVQKFTSNGSYLTQWGSSGSDPGEFTSPGGIAVDPSGNVYVVDIYTYRVEKFTGSGTFLTQWGSQGSGNGQFTAPTGIAVASSGTVYVADRNTSRIQAFSPTGTYLFQWGTAGSGPGQIDDPGGLAFGAGGDLYEADVYNARIQRFSTLACTAIPGATSNTYPQTRDDMGKTIRVEVVVDNGVPPPEEALSFPTTPVLAIPQDSSSPTIAGIPAEGEALTASSGTWSGYPTLTLSFQWQRCEQDGTGCTDITGATNPTYTATGSDVGKKLRVTETGTNVAGDATANSPQVGPVTGPPVNTEPPSVTGALVLGSTLTANPGTWSGYPTPTLSFQWQRCDAGGTNCTDISGATGQTYVLAAADEGKEIRIVVTAVNSVESVRSDSAPTGEVEPVPVPPTPSGKPKLRVEVTSPWKIEAGREFGMQIAVANLAREPTTTRKATVRANSTMAKSVRACVRLPRGVVVAGKGARGKVDGQTLCWTRRSLAAGDAFSRGFRARTVRGMSGTATFRITVSATNSDGATASTRAIDRVEVSPAKRPEPKPPTG